jgi:nucleoside-diphosphate-sugar epimerase
VHGDGEALWVSCHIDDVASAFVNTVGSQKTFGKAYHVTGEEWQTWNQYHERLAEAIGAPTPTLIHIPADILVRIAPEQSMITYLNFQYTNIFDNSAAKADLGFEYTIDWQTGARRTYEWLAQNNKIESWQSFPIYDRIIESLRTQCNELVAGVANLNKK